MEKQILRKVKVSSQRMMRNFEAYFHAFGFKAHPLDNGMDLQVSTAIVEDQEGKVYEVEPNEITFIERFEKESSGRTSKSNTMN